MPRLNAPILSRPLSFSSHSIPALTRYLGGPLPHRMEQLDRQSYSRPSSSLASVCLWTLRIRCWQTTEACNQRIDFLRKPVA
ncbi:hypothetical protein B0H67DRAFT_255883 [Lasiosphaeris hirsuta]|uniref:Uncharacterized protein n=1 Tax=Lasiosphaeris hirsuta TaxID=260670 RepID=A0AA40AHM6_9PEZI|nr:hypothetical protein B0H67DRAFT_255883 [Lasiosphaeris hirsuta]